MKQYLLPVLFLMTFLPVKAQRVIFDNMPNRLYAHAQNKLEIVGCDANCEQLFISTNNGEVTKHGCSIILKPDTVKETTLELYQINNKDTIFTSSWKYATAPFPLPDVFLAQKNSGTIRINQLKATANIFARTPDWELTGCFEPYITQFRLIVMRNNDLVGSVLNEGRRFSNETKNLVEKTNPGDRVYVVDIYARSPVGKENIKLNPLEFDIN